jgi:hypothetical protein
MMDASITVINLVHFIALVGRGEEEQNLVRHDLIIFIFMIVDMMGNAAEAHVEIRQAINKATLTLRPTLNIWSR